MSSPLLAQEVGLDILAFLLPVDVSLTQIRLPLIVDVAFGASTGSIYLFTSAALTYRQLFSLVRSEVTQVRLSQITHSPQLRFHPIDDNQLAIGTRGGDVLVVELNVVSLRERERVVSRSFLLLNSPQIHRHTSHAQPVTCLQWNSTGSLLFSGDASGVVLVTRDPRSSKSSLFQRTGSQSSGPQLVFKGDSSVVQLDCRDTFLLVSTLTRCSLVDAESFHSVDVGSKPHKGAFGACFIDSGSTQLEFLCARQGMRLWRADSEGGRVIATLKFKELLDEVPATKLLRLLESDTPPTQPVFSRLCPVGSCILSWSDSSILLVNATAEPPSLVAWHNDVYGLRDMCVFGDAAYLVHEYPRGHPTVSRVAVVEPHRGARMLISEGDIGAATNLVLSYRVHHTQLLSSIADALEADSPLASELEQLRLEAAEASKDVQEHVMPASVVTVLRTDEEPPSPVDESMTVKSIPDTNTGTDQDDHTLRSEGEVREPEWSVAPTATVSDGQQSTKRKGKKGRRWKEANIEQWTPTQLSPVIPESNPMKVEPPLAHIAAEGAKAALRTFTRVSQTPQESPPISAAPDSSFPVAQIATEPIEKKVKPRRKKKKEEGVKKVEDVKKKEVEEVKKEEVEEVKKEEVEEVKKEEVEEVKKEEVEEVKKEEVEEVKKEEVEEVKKEEVEEVQVEATPPVLLIPQSPAKKQSRPLALEWETCKDNPSTDLKTRILHWAATSPKEHDGRTTMLMTACLTSRMVSDPVAFIIEHSSYLDIDETLQFLQHTRQGSALDALISATTEEEPLVKKVTGSSATVFLEVVGLIARAQPPPPSASHDNWHTLISQTKPLALWFLSVLRVLPHLWSLDPTSDALVELCVHAHPRLSIWASVRTAPEPSATALLAAAMRVHGSVRSDSLMVEKYLELLLKHGNTEAAEHIICSDLFAFDTERVLALCVSHGFSHGVRVLLVRLGRLRDAMNLALDADDLEAFTSIACPQIPFSPFIISPPKPTIADWRWALGRSVKLSAINSDAVLRLMLRREGASVTLQLLIDLEELPQTSPDVFKECLLAGQAHTRRDETVHSMLEVVDSYLWAKPVSALSPQMRLAKDRETAGDKNPYVKEVQSGYELLFTHDAPLIPTAENSGGHWGVRCQLGHGAVCSVCTLPLAVDSSSPSRHSHVDSVAVYPCGHAYHQNCVPDDACLSCMERVARAAARLGFD